MVPPTTHSVSTLRGHLLNALSTLPGHRIFDIHVLVSTQRKPNESLFPYLSPKPRSFMQEVLILLSERAPSTNSVEGAPSPAVFVTAIEADIFYFPSSVSTILYISKVDGTGQGTYPSPTSTLVNALLQFYGSPTSPIYPNRNHTLWVHLFARAQRQYLFPNSADHLDKKPLGDVALCKWWKKSLGKAALDILNSYKMVDPLRQERIDLSANLFYIMPGQSEAEATYSLGNATSTEIQWTYSHPYDIHKSHDIPFASASPGSEGKEHYLPSLIPYFDDDPKSRFLDELAATREERTIAVPIPTPKRKKRKLSPNNSNGNHNDIVVKMSAQESPTSTFTPQSPGIRMPQPEPSSHPLIALIPPSSSPPRIDDDEPIERPSTPEPNLEEQVLETPQTPHFPRLTTSLLSPHTPQNSTLRAFTSSAQLTPRSKVSKLPHTPKSPRRPTSDLDKVTTTEFWERMSFRQECAQTVTGFFVAVFPQKYLSDGEEVDVSDAGPSILVNGTVPHTIIKRIMTSLLTGVEFSTVERSHKATQVIETTIKGLCDGLRDTTSSENSLTPEDDTGIYSRHVHATLIVDNPPIFRKQSYPSTADGPPVNILGVRRKKKRD